MQTFLEGLTPDEHHVWLTYLDGTQLYYLYAGRDLWRDEQALDLMTAVAKMTLLPARRLEAVAPAMARKGRVQVGADADLTLFDPGQVADRATFMEPAQASAGIRHVLVGGVPVVRDGVIQEGVFPGQAVLGGSAARP